VHDREVGDEAALHHIRLAVELAQLLALGDEGADAGLGEERRDARPARADALGERPLRVELDLELAREILLREGLVLADVRRDHLPNLPGVEEEPEPGVVDAGVVGDDRQPLHPGLADRLDQGLGDAAQAEAAGHDHHVVPQQAGERRLGVGVNLVHSRLRPASVARKPCAPAPSLRRQPRRSQGRPQFRQSARDSLSQ
jgi:hypothetical protein